MGRCDCICHAFMHLAHATILHFYLYLSVQLVIVHREENHLHSLNTEKNMTTTADSIYRISQWGHYSRQGNYKDYTIFVFFLSNAVYYLIALQRK